MVLGSRTVLNCSPDVGIVSAGDVILQDNIARKCEEWNRYQGHVHCHLQGQ